MVIELASRAANYGLRFRRFESVRYPQFFLGWVIALESGTERST